MSQAEFLRQFDDDARAGFLAIGLADAATYTAPGGAAIPCTVMVDADTAEFGEVARVNDRTRIITLFRADVPQPVRGAVVVIDGVSWELVSPRESDDSKVPWVARHV